jgi:hypothetical protein
MKLIGVFKYKEEVLFNIFDCKHCFFCKLNFLVNWEQFTSAQKSMIGEAFKLSKQFKSVEEFKNDTKNYDGEFYFEWKEVENEN